jgi:hypothetical protein
MRKQIKVSQIISNFSQQKYEQNTHDVGYVEILIQIRAVALWERTETTLKMLNKQWHGHCEPDTSLSSPGPLKNRIANMNNAKGELYPVDRRSIL